MGSLATPTTSRPGRRPRRRRGALLTTQTPIDLFLSRVEASGGDGNWNAHCPAHQDHNSSLSISVGDDGRVLTHCHAGCPTDQITAAIGLTLADLFPNQPANGNGNGGPKRSKTVGPTEQAALAAYLTEANRRLAADTPLARRCLDYLHRRFGLDRDDALELGLGVDPGSSVTDRPDYLARFNGPPRLVIPFNTPDGQPAGCQGRALTDTDGQRVHRWETPKGTGWARTAHMALAAPDPVIITEGPGDALTAVAAGYAAAGIRGASLGRGNEAAREIHEALQDRHLAIAGDADAAGRQFARHLAEQLAALGHTVTVVDVPEHHGDLAGWYEHSRDTFAGELAVAIETADPVEPPPAEPAGTSDDDDGPERGPALSDLGNARRLVARMGGDFRHVPQWGRWLHWNGRCWQRDVTGDVHRRAKETAESILVEAACETDPDERKRKLKHWITSEGEARIRAAITLAATEPAIPVEPDQLDRQHWLIACSNGTVDLRTGQLRDHARADMLTHSLDVEYQPGAQCPTWIGFLERVMAGNHELISFLQRAAGYTLTGDVSEQVLFFLYGAGANGKSTFIRALMDLLGDYATQAEADLLIARRNDPHPTGLADLHGRRLAVAMEVDEGRRLAEALVKQLTGGDRIKARLMHKDFFEYDPTHKLWMAANHKPVVRGTDNAIWRRIKLIPFLVSIPEEERDKRLPDKLHEERSGILSWVVRGCLDWQQHGLGTPAEVAEATAGYRNEMDTLGQFLDEHCVTGEGLAVASAELRKAYVEWAEAMGEPVLSQKAIGAHLTERGYQRERNPRTKRWLWLGIDLATHGTHRDPYPEKSSHTHAHRGDLPENGSRWVQGSRPDELPLDGNPADDQPPIAEPPEDLDEDGTWEF